MSQPPFQIPVVQLIYGNPPENLPTVPYPGAGVGLLGMVTIEQGTGTTAQKFPIRRKLSGEGIWDPLLFASGQFAACSGSVAGVGYSVAGPGLYIQVYDHLSSSLIVYRTNASPGPVNIAYVRTATPATPFACPGINTTISSAYGVTEVARFPVQLGGFTLTVP